MEFFLVPLLAIAGVTVGINKLARLFFHIRLSWKLLAMLVGFAWLISLVLPGMFFHSAGFAGSVGISLVCAVGFAWLATVYDARTHAVQSDTATMENPVAAGELIWTPAAENAFPVVPDFVDLQKEQVLEISVQEHTPAEPVKLPVHFLSMEENVEQSAKEAVLPVRPEVSVPLPEVEDYIPVATEDYIPVQIEQIPVKPLIESLIQTPVEMSVATVPETSALMPEETSDELLIQTPVEMSVATVPETSAMMPEEKTGAVFEEPGGLVLEAAAGDDTIEPMPVELQNQQVFPTIAEQPASDSLEDLLEFAFEQRSHRNMTGALDAFRLVRLQYGDSDAVPLVSAELVSTLQSCGDYEGALTELDQALQLPLVQRDNRMVEVFTQKQKYLRALQDLLREQGKPNLPFEQIPAEWSEWLEWKLSTGPSAQS